MLISAKGEFNFLWCKKIQGVPFELKKFPLFLSFQNVMKMDTSSSNFDSGSAPYVLFVFSKPSEKFQNEEIHKRFSKHLYLSKLL